MGINNPTGNGESEPGAAASCAFASIEFPEYLVDILRGYAPAVVGHTDDTFVLLDVRGDVDRCCSGSVNRCIMEDVDQDLFEQSLIRLDEGHGFGHVDLDPEVSNRGGGEG